MIVMNIRRYSVGEATNLDAVAGRAERMPFVQRARRRIQPPKR
jgi:hypothetical protein